LTITTTGPSAAIFAPHQIRFSPIYGIWLPLPGIALVGAGFAGSRKRKLGFALGLVLLLSMMLMLAGCGGGGSSSNNGGGGTQGTPAGTYNVTVTATSGSTAHTTSVSLTVQ
jgi:hypothetical protein